MMTPLLRSLAAGHLAGLLIVFASTAAAQTAPQPRAAAPSPAQPHDATAGAIPADTPVSVPAPEVQLLQGKLAFALPGGFAANALPPGDTADGTGGSQGQVYSNTDTRQVVVISETPLPPKVAAGTDDSAFLKSAAHGYVSQQKQVSVEYAVTGEDSLRSGTLGLRRIDARGHYAGTPTLSTSLLASAGPTLAVVQIISRADDPQGHQTLWQQVQAALPPPAPTPKRKP